MRAHIITDGKVSNTIEVDTLDFMPGLINGDLGGSIGDLWDGKTFIKPSPPPPVVPDSVTMRQARLALLAAGKLAAVNSAIAGMTGAQGETARIEWEFSSEVKRQQPLVLSLGKALGMTEAQMDALFITAAAL